MIGIAATLVVTIAGLFGWCHAILGSFHFSISCLYAGRVAIRSSLAAYLCSIILIAIFLATEKVTCKCSNHQDTQRRLNKRLKVA